MLQAPSESQASIARHSIGMPAVGKSASPTSNAAQLVFLDYRGLKCSRFRVAGVWGLGLGFGVGFGVWGLWFGVWGLGFGVWGGHVWV